jgi:hypothetical protein
MDRNLLRSYVSYSAKTLVPLLVVPSPKTDTKYLSVAYSGNETVFQGSGRQEIQREHNTYHGRMTSVITREIYIPIGFLTKPPLTDLI